MKPSTRSRHRFGLMAMWITLGLSAWSISFADDKPKAGATGTWSWNVSFRNGDPIRFTLKLKEEAGKLSGVQVSRDGMETPIQDGSIRDGHVSFTVSRERGGQEIVTRFRGQLSGDKIEGTMESNFGGAPSTRPWAAKREAPKGPSKVDATGLWQWTFTTQAGQNFEPTVKLTQEQARLSGAVKWGNNEMPIENGSIEENRISFKVVRERDGRRITTQYEGKVQGDAIEGKIESDWNGELRTFDWQAKRIAGPQD